MSVQLSPHSIGHGSPAFSQPVNLLGFARVINGDLLKRRNFTSHHLKISNRPLPCPRHICVSVQGLAGENDALIGFVGGHGGNVPEGFRPW